MASESKKFRLEVGINLYAAPVPQTNPNMRIFPLQNALIDVTGGDHQHAKPAWYSRLSFDDEISFRLVDISRLRVPSHEPDYPKLVLAHLYFNNPMTGRPADPFTETVVEWRLSDRLEDQASPVFSADSAHLLPTWDLVGLNIAGENLQTLRFAKLIEGTASKSFRAFELTMVLKMVREGWVNHYVFDPEMIVSETDNEGDGSGGKGSS